MKPTRFFLMMFLFFMVVNCNQPDSEMVSTEEEVESSAREYYQLKVYTFDTDEQVQATDKYLEEAYLPALKRINIGPVGVFKFRPTEEDTIKKTYVLLPFSSFEQWLTLDAALEKDEAYLAAGSDYINASHEQPPYQRIESTILGAFTDMPQMQTPNLEGPRSERIYELRSYESPTERYYWNKVDMFNAGGEIKLFDRLEFNAVFYGEVISGANMPNLMYMTTFSDQARRDALWKAFFGSPEWEALKSMEKYKNNVSHADIIFLYPTAYSDY